MFTFFLNTNKLNYSKLNINHSEFIPINLNIERIYNFIWTYLGTTNNEFIMVAVLLENNKFRLKKIVFVINEALIFFSIYLFLFTAYFIDKFKCICRRGSNN